MNIDKAVYGKWTFVKTDCEPIDGSKRYRWTAEHPLYRVVTESNHSDSFTMSDFVKETLDYNKPKK